MKHIAIYLSMLLLVACSGLFGETTNEIIIGDEAEYVPYYFEYFRNMIALEVTPKSDVQLDWYFANKTGYSGIDAAIDVPKEDYDRIRQELGDTHPFFMSDATPTGTAFIRDFTEILVTSDSDYCGIAAGESLNSKVIISYITCLPWVQSNYNGGWEGSWTPQDTNVECPLNEFDPRDLDGSYGKGYLKFIATPAPEQQFIIEFSGGSQPISKTFCLTPRI